MIGSVKTVVAVAAAALGVMAAGAASAAPVVHAKGFWTMDVSQAERVCSAGVTIENTGAFVLLALNGDLTFGLRPAKPVTSGKALLIETAKEAFEYRPTILANGSYIHNNDSMTAEAVAAVRRADDVWVMMDGAQILSLHLAGSGVGDVIDDLIDCSRGKSGWWGAGVTPPAKAGVPAKPTAPVVSATPAKKK